MFDVLDRTHRAITGSHRAVMRVEVWRRGEQLANLEGTDLDFVSGGITDKWVSGIRRSLSLTVPGTKEWREWLTVGVEIRPYRGVDFGGPGVIQMCPLGVFPILNAARPRSASSLSVSAADRWQRIVDNTLLYARNSPAGSIRDAIASLITDAETGAPVIQQATSQAPMITVLWDKDRQQTIIDLAASIGAEVFMDRDGSPVIRDRITPGAPVTTFRTGPGGNLVGLSESVDWAKVYNEIAVSSSNTDVVFDPVILAVTDPADPAHYGNIGAHRTKKFSSPLFENRDQAVLAAVTYLAKGRAPAQQWSISCPVDPSLDAGDTVLVQNAAGGYDTCQIDTVSIPLTAGEAQSITTVSTREDTD